MIKRTSITANFTTRFFDFNYKHIYIVFDKKEWNFIKEDFLVKNNYLYDHTNYYNIDDEVLIDDKFILIKFKIAKIKDIENFDFYYLRQTEFEKIIEE